MRRQAFYYKWDSYYKMQSLMQIAKIHVFFEAKDQVILLLCYYYDWYFTSTDGL